MNKVRRQLFDLAKGSPADDSLREEVRAPFSNEGFFVLTIFSMLSTHFPSPLASYPPFGVCLPQADGRSAGQDSG